MNILTKPKHKLTLGTTAYECEVLTSAKVIRRENGIDIATIGIDNENFDIFPAVVTSETAIQLEVTNEGEAYPANPMFKGVVRFPVANIAKDSNSVALSCLGSGRGLMKMLVANEYGAQSVNSGNDTITEIINGAAHGIIPRYVNRILGAGAEGDSGFLYDVSDIETINDVINYIEFGYKPADKSINDLIDILSALKAGSAGAHWIITTDDHFRLKLLTSTQAGEWDKYYGASQANATLTYGEDFEDYNLEVQKAEGNYVIYYGNFRRPSNGDAFTQSHLIWGSSASITLSTDTTIYAVGTASVKALRKDMGTPLRWFYPSAKNAGWDFTSFGSIQYIPTISFLAYRSGLTSLTLYLYTDDTHASRVNLYNSVGGPSMEGDTWIGYSVPIGTYWKSQPNNSWRWITEAANPVDWSEVNWIEFGLTGLVNEYADIDGLQFGNVPITRVAWNSDLPSGTAEMCLIVDNIGKDDSLVASDDSGVMAQLAYAELLRQQKETFNLILKMQMLHEALPGQWFYMNGTDMRTPQLIQEIQGKDYTTTLSLTDDVTNGRARLRYEDLNKQYANLRPEFQDRQATSIKAGSIDYRIARLVKDYAP